jgi:hypothetical protein
MKKLPLPILALCFLLFPQPAHCDAIHVDAAQLEAVSLACSDGTRVFGIQGNGVTSSVLLVEKDGIALYYNDAFEEIQHINGIYCLKNGIVIMGMHGPYFSTSVIPFNYDGLWPENIGVTRSPACIEESMDATKVSLYGDDRHGDDDTIIKSTIFYKLFQANIGANTTKVTYSPKVHIFGAVEKDVYLSTMSACYGENAPDAYTIMAYTDDKGKSYVSIGDWALSDVGYAATYTMPLPFTATNSMCFNGETYLFGLQEDELRATRLSFTANGEKRLELIDPAIAPLRPAIQRHAIKEAR